MTTSYPNQNLIQPENNPALHWQEWLKTAILLLMGVYFIWLIGSGKLSNYINLRFQWLTVVAIILFFLPGIWSLVRLIRGARGIQQAQTSFAHNPVTWQSMGIVAIPLILALVVPSQPLGADAVSGGVSLNAVGGESSLVTYEQNPLQRNILDWLREFDRADNPALFNRQEIRVSGFVYREIGMTDNQFMVARFTMSCCVADAFAIGIPVEMDNAADFEDGVWVEVEGTLEAGQFVDRNTPIIQPDNITPIEMPDNPYLYS
ncbi:MAG: TIGR03943 family putative permease subunit [Aggregatilineales bacterium]